MATTLRSLLNRALYLSISDRVFSPVQPSGEEINAALDIFVQVLDTYRTQIPYISKKTLENESELTNINAAYVNSLIYIINGGSNGTTTYPIKKVTAEVFSNNETVLNLRQLPAIFWHNRDANLIEVYPLPQQSSDKFIMTYIPEVDINNLDLAIDSSVRPFMQLFLQYEIASQLCNEYSIAWSSQKEVSRQRYYNELLENADNDVSPAIKVRLSRRRYPVPWLAYLSGNLPGST